MKIIYLLGIGLSLITSCGAQPIAEFQLKADAFEKGIQGTDAQLLDVRTAAEYKSGHLKQSLQADWNNTGQFKDRTQYLDKNKPLYVYCLSGGRSASAAKWLRQQGYQQVYELAGGITSWRNSGKPVEGEASGAQMSLAQYQQLINSFPVVLVDVGASWCPPCKKMEPVLDALQKEKGTTFLLVKVDGGRDLEVMKLLNVEALPVFIIYKNGKPTWRQQGVVSKELLLTNL